MSTRPKRSGKRSSGNGRSARRRAADRRRANPELERALKRAQRLIDRGRPEEAVDLLEMLVESEPDNPDVHLELGSALAAAEDAWGAMYAWEQAQALSDPGEHLIPLASLYLSIGFAVHALRVFHRVLDRAVDSPFVGPVSGIVAQLEQDLAETAQEMARPIDQVEQGLYDLERGLRATIEENPGDAVTAFRRAIRRLGDWPPALINLSEALFTVGQAEEALVVVRRVLADHPRDVQALGSAIRFLALSGREEEARELWARCVDVEPQGPEERFSQGEVAAILGEHESVYQILMPFGDKAADDELPPFVLNRARCLLGIAAANMGRRKEAERRLRPLQAAKPLAAETLAGLKKGRSGTGWAPYFRYFRPMDLMPPLPMEEFLALAIDLTEERAQRFERRLRQFAKRYAQVILVCEKMIWEEQEAEAGIMMLSTIGTSEAYAALRRFAFSEAGSDEERMKALGALLEAGEIEEGETVRAWLDGEWRSIEMRMEMIPRERARVSDYSQPVIHMLNRAGRYLARGEDDRAEDLLERILEFDPHVKEAYNNLGSIYARRGEFERARAMFRRALEIDPQYVFAVGNLASFLLDEGRAAEAEKLISPLPDTDDLLPQEAAYIHFVRARILVQERQYEDAVKLLQAALEVMPDYEPARDMLEWMEDWQQWEYWDEQWERDLAWREELQQGLTTLEPSLADALPLYTKDMLTAMAREIQPQPGWSSLRKAELVDAVIEALTDREKLWWSVRSSREELQEALSTVLDRGGAMTWDDFNARYDSDLDESRYWHWYTPESTMGLLRLYGLLVEAKVEGELYVVVPVELREPLREILQALSD